MHFLFHHGDLTDLAQGLALLAVFGVVLAAIAIV